MRRIEVSPEAELEAENILHQSLLEFGDQAAERYSRLIKAAYRDIADDPERAGVFTLTGIPADLRLYPIRHSRARLPKADRVGQPRHVVAFRFDAERVEIVNLLHDRMDLPAGLG